MDGQVTFRPERKMTQKEFVRWLKDRRPDDLHHYELIHGRIVMSPPASFGHGRAGTVIVHSFHDHVARRKLGVVLSAQAGFDLPSGDTLEPDAAFVSNQRLAAAGPQRLDRFAAGVPDLVVEILSPSTARRDRTEKKEVYAVNGVREYWIVDLRRRQVVVYALRDGGYDAGTIFTSGVVSSDVLPGLRLRVDEIFPD